MNDLQTVTPQANGMTVDQMLAQKHIMKDLMSKVLKKGEHYGLIPGCGDKPALFKSGAEVVGLTFGIHPEFTVKMTDLKDGHREYEVSCHMFRNSDKMELGGGVGMCSTMEKKYRYRTVKRLNKQTGKEEKVTIENPNIEDVYNTVLKMAKKRAFVDAILTSTAASDFFSQDLEDMPVQENPYKTELSFIDSLDELSLYYKKHVGRGADFDKAVIARRKELTTNPPKKDVKD